VICLRPDMKFGVSPNRVALGGVRWRVGIGRIDAATALGSARAERRAKPRHPQVCAWLNVGALTLGLRHNGHARSTLACWTPTYEAPPFTTRMRWGDDAFWVHVAAPIRPRRQPKSPRRYR
jgi:hypothetical protein